MTKTPLSLLFKDGKETLNKGTKYHSNQWRTSRIGTMRKVVIYGT
jgi:hypothetical protein